eukprot:6209223-Pleurochrysis_carterae.AAC.10
MQVHLCAPLNSVKANVMLDSTLEPSLAILAPKKSSDSKRKRAAEQRSHAASWGVSNAPRGCRLRRL